MEVDVSIFHAISSVDYIHSKSQCLGITTRRDDDVSNAVNRCILFGMELSCSHQSPFSGLVPPPIP